MKSEIVFVYILILDYKKYYTGITNDLNRRLKEHRNNKRGYTARFTIKDYIFIYECENRSIARKIEVKIKKQGAKRFLLKNQRIIQNDRKLKLFRK